MSFYVRLALLRAKKKEIMCSSRLTQLMMVSSYKHGINGFHTEKREALCWYKLAEEQNNPLAINELAFLCEEGEVVQQSVSKAVELMTKAADTDVDGMVLAWLCRSTGGLVEGISLPYTCMQQDDRRSCCSIQSWYVIL